jgi:hypothetical protein
MATSVDPREVPGSSATGRSARTSGTRLRRSSRGAGAWRPISNVALVVIVVVLVASAVMGGLLAKDLPRVTSAGSAAAQGAAPGVAYSQAAAMAATSAASVPGGPWSAVGGLGLIVRSAVPTSTAELNATLAPDVCAAQLLSGASSVTSIPATTSSASSGQSEAWLVLFTNASAGLLSVAVLAGSSTPLLTYTYLGACAATGISLSLPPDYLNSPAAAATAASHGGSAWAGSRATYDVEEYLSAEVTFAGEVPITTPSIWEVSYTTCDLGSSDGATLDGQAAATFSSLVYASNGTFLGAGNSSAACAP